MTLSGRQVAELLARHGLHPSRALGQNFVADPNTVRRIARLAEVGPDDSVLEVGPGLGSLTLALAETGARVLAVEADRHLMPVLDETLAGSGVRVMTGDALRLDWAAVLGTTPWVMVSNLPYNIATPLIADLLDRVPVVERMLVMVQREVAERLVAGPGQEAYGAVSVKVAYWSEARVLGRVPASVFVPRPRIESALVAIRRRPEPALDPLLVPADELFAMVRAGFATRRKMLRRSLAGLIEPEAFAIAGVAPDARAEQLDLPAWGRLVRAHLTRNGASPV